MLRISLIIAIIAGLAAAGLNFYKVRDVMVTTKTDLDNTKATLAQTVQDLNSTKSELTKTQEDLGKTKSTLAETEKDLKSTSGKLAQAEKKVVDLSTDLDRTKNDRDAAQQKLAAWDVLQVSPDQVRGILSDLRKTKELNEVLVDENKLITKKANDLQNEIDQLIGKKDYVQLPKDLRGTIIAVDPKFDFVVIDVGGNSNVLERGEMLVNRNGKLIGKIKISAVQPTQSIANVDPAWKKDEIVEGDQVIARIH